jgi:hypothetical protein
MGKKQSEKMYIHPRRIFKTPEDLYKAFQAYKDDLKEQAKEWVKIQYVGKDGDRVTDPFKLPYVLEGFYVFCYSRYGNVKQYFVNQDKEYDDFITICSQIKEEIRTNQITGGLLGMYNPSITQRLNGLKEQTETEIKANVTMPIPDIGKRK